MSREVVAIPKDLWRQQNRLPDSRSSALKAADSGVLRVRH